MLMDSTSEREKERGRREDPGFWTQAGGWWTEMLVTELGETGEK